MHDWQTTALETAASLLQINAIKINIRNPFTWVSGIRSPIYCDNRQSLSYPDIRSRIAADMAGIVFSKFPACEVIAGVATGAIAHGVLVAERLNLPFVYVRSSKKSHGLSNLIEGNLRPGMNVVVVEDLVSTGQSSLEAVRALRASEAKVLGMVAIFSYELPLAVNALKTHDCRLFTLTNFSALLQQSKNTGLLTNEETDMLNQWRNNPETFYNGKL